MILPGGSDKPTLWDRSKKPFEIIGGVAALLSVLTVAISAGQFLKERNTRRRTAIYSAWGVVSGMENKHADGGRAEALKQLRDNGQSFAGIVLTGAVLSRVDLSHSDLSSAALNNVKFSSCDFDHSTFTQADFSKGVFRPIVNPEQPLQIEPCTFRGASFDGNAMLGSIFTDDDFSGATFHDTHGDKLTSFNGSDLSNATIADSTFDKSIFDSAIMRGIKVLGGSFLEARFQQAKMEGCHFSNVDVQGAQFQKAEMNDCSFELTTDLRGARFDRVRACKVTFDAVDLRNAKFFGAILNHATFIGSDVRGVDFTSAQLFDVHFVDTKMDGATFPSFAVDRASADDACKAESP